MDVLNVFSEDFMYFYDLQPFEYKKWLFKYDSFRDRVNTFNSRIDMHICKIVVNKDGKIIRVILKIK